jgi:hypothetical protein
MRNNQINLRISEDELKLIDELRAKRVMTRGKTESRIDTIIAAIKFASGILPLKEVDERKFEF